MQLYEPYSYIYKSIYKPVVLKIWKNNQFFRYIKSNNSVQKSQKIKCHYQSPDLINVYQIHKILSKSIHLFKDIEQNAVLNLNQGPQLCNHLTKFTHLQSQDTPSQYQLSCKVWKKIGKEISKIANENQFLTSIKGNNYVLICRNLPICNLKTLLPDINSYTKFEENWLKNEPGRELNEALTDGRTDGRTDTRLQIFERRV